MLFTPVFLYTGTCT